jgi:hypothetical protein
VEQGASNEEEAKVDRLSLLAREAFAALDRGEGISLEGEREVASFVAGLGQRVVERLRPEVDRDETGYQPERPP